MGNGNDTVQSAKSLPGNRSSRTKNQNLFPFLMTVLSQSFLTLMRRNFMTLSFFTTRHTTLMFLFI